MKIYVITLAYNLASEVEKATKRLYEQNERNFTHYIVGLGFPLIKDEIPEDIEAAQFQNAEALKEIASRFGSLYVEFPNVGCSQNWTAIHKHINPKDNDVFVSCEPDEVQVEDGWVNALAHAIKGGLAYCAPRLVEHEELLANSPYAKLKTIGGEDVYVMSGELNHGQIAYSCKFLNLIGGVPYPADAPIYGYLESELGRLVREHGLQWGLLRNYTTEHTDYEKGTIGASRLLREWKNDMIFAPKKTNGQIQFEEWLIKRRDG